MVKGKIMTEELLFYGQGKDVELLDALTGATTPGAYRKAAGDLFSMAAERGYRGNLWHCYLTNILLLSENPYSIAAERRGAVEGTLSEAVMRDLKVMRDLFYYPFDEKEEALGIKVPIAKHFKAFISDGSEGLRYSSKVADAICHLADDLSKSFEIIDFKRKLDDFYAKYGVGMMGLHKAFRVDREESKLKINPIFHIAVTSLDDLVGYEIPKAKLVANTEAFLAGREANNCLIFGEAGTGKSSSIRALLNTYYDKGLRMIEVYKHQYKELNDLIDSLKRRNYRFVIYMDDLSFEEFETDYKYLKAVIEGGLESRPDNVLIYATSNRRHLVRENYTDREEGANDKHSTETMQEKLSLYSRFGETIYFGAPTHQEYEEIVKELARRYEIPLTEKELLAEANKWEIQHGGVSGRTARHFIDAMRAKYCVAKAEKETSEVIDKAAEQKKEMEEKSGEL